MVWSWGGDLMVAAIALLFISFLYHYNQIIGSVLTYYTAYL